MDRSGRASSRRTDASRPRARAWATIAGWSLSVMLLVMPESLTMRIPDVRDAVSRALDLVEAALGTEVTLPWDYYWHLPAGASFDMAKQPEDLTVGELSDDLAEVLDDHERVPAEAWHELSHVIGLLRALETAVQP